MARDQDPAFRAWVLDARATPIAGLIEARHVRLRGDGEERIGGCPSCGDGGKRDADRFRINTVKNVWACRQCAPKGGDVIELVRMLDGVDFRAACTILTGRNPPSGPLSPVDFAALAAREAEQAEKRRTAASEQDTRREAERVRCWELWEAAKPAAGTLVEDYLRLRCLTLPPGKALRFAPSARLYGEKRPGQDRRPLLHTGPAMVAAILRPDGRFGGIHQTWIDLSDAGGKARILDPETGVLTAAKKVRGSQRGGRIELVACPGATRLVTGEGNETTLSARDDLIEAGEDVSRTAFWCAINLGNLGGPHKGNVAHPTLKDRGGKPQRVPSGWPSDKAELPAIPVPDSITEIIILGDGDSDPFTTRLAVDRASRRWSKAGRIIRGAFALDAMDFNDMRRKRLARER